MPFNLFIMIIYLDTETTGLRPGNICQLSYIKQYRDRVEPVNIFFSVDFVEMSAYAVHHFSVELLKKLSNGKRFNHYAKKIAKDFASANLICAHNVSFDFSFLRKEFETAGEDFKYNEIFCSMKKFTPICKLKRTNSLGYKYPKLNELCAFLGITDSEIERETNNLFNEKLLFHDARYDTTAVYLAVNKALNTLEEFSYIKELL